MLRVSLIHPTNKARGLRLPTKHAYPRLRRQQQQPRPQPSAQATASSSTTTTTSASVSMATRWQVQPRGQPAAQAEEGGQEPGQEQEGVDEPPPQEHKRRRRRGGQQDESKRLHFRALTAARSGQLEKAAVRFTEALEHSPDNAPTLNSAACFHAFQLGDINRARHLFKRAVEADPSSAAALQAWARMEGGRRGAGVARARELFEKATVANPKHAPAWQAWALLEAGEGRPADARNLLRKAHAADPSHAPTLQAWAALEWERFGDIHHARRLFEKGAALSPPHGPLLRAWAVLEAGQKASVALSGSVDRAAELYERVREAEPADPRTWLMYGHFRHAQGELELARELYQRGLQLAKDNTHLLHALALTEWSVARDLLHHLVTIDPRSARAWYLLGDMAERGGDVAGARASYRRGCERGGAGVKRVREGEDEESTAVCYGAWAALEAAQGNAELARAVFREGDEHEPGNALLLQKWALFEKRYGTPDAARALFQRSADADPRLARTYLLWGQWERRCGSSDSARACFARGLEAKRKNAFLWQAWAVMESQLGNVDEARELFERGTNELRRARELFAKGASLPGPPHLPLLQAWAAAEESAVTNNHDNDTDEMERKAALETIRALVARAEERAGKGPVGKGDVGKGVVGEGAVGDGDGDVGLGEESARGDEGGDGGPVREVITRAGDATASRT
eukprot:jgi/Chlat1/1682/Chrsp127S00091